MDIGNIEKENKKNKKKGKLGFFFKNQIENIQGGGIHILVTVFLTFLAVVISCLAVFFTSVQGQEKVMVPNVIGKNWSTAFLEMQAKELYPKLILRYSEKAGEEGLVLEQDPPAGSIVKAYHKVSVTVSRGIAIDRLEDYVGKNIDDVQTKLRTLFSGTSTLQIQPTVYQVSESPAGQILAQYPGGGTFLSDSVKVYFVVSAGSSMPQVTVPDLKDASMQQLFAAMENSRLLFTFNQQDAPRGQNHASVIKVQKADQKVEAFSTVTVDLSFPIPSEDDTDVYGILNATIDSYPYPVPIHLEENDEDGNTRTIVSFSHPGGKVEVPYSAKKGSILTLYTMDQIVAQETVR